MNIVTYGKGNLFQRYFVKTDFWKKYLENEGKNIIASIDSSEIDCLSYLDYDEIIVVTKKYYDEILCELLERGISKEIVRLFDDYKNHVEDTLFNYELFEGKKGVEIGGISSIFDRLYLRCEACDNVVFNLSTIWRDYRTGVYEWGGKRLGKVIEADATDLSIIDVETYDFVISSNNLEHIANPIRALEEFKRVCKKGGMIVVVVPRKEETFDHNRDYTDFEHILDDFVNKVSERDLTHLPEIIEKHDYKMDGDITLDKFKKRSLRNFENRGLHHHVFSPSTLRDMFEYENLSVEKVFRYERNYVILGYK